MPSEQPLSGVTIADFTQMMQGPWATQKLGEMGADVIKIERTDGEWQRRLTAGGELLDGISPYFLALNRTKRSVALDLSDETGREIARKIVESSDVIVENFRPGVMESFDLAYEHVKEFNPEIIYVSASGFGSDGPYVDRPGQDLLIQAMSGMTQITGKRSDRPTSAGTSVIDAHSAMQIALNIMFALYHRERTGEGQLVETNLLNAAIDLQCQEVTAELNTDRTHRRSESGISHYLAGAPYGIYETADGHIAIAMADPDILGDIFDLPILQTDLEAAELYERRDELKPAIEAKTRQYDSEQLLEELLAADVWAAQVNDYYEMADDPQVQHNDMLLTLDHPHGGEFITPNVPAELSKTPGNPTKRPPRIGEHSRAVLSELGYEAGSIESLENEGVISITDSTI